MAVVLPVKRRLPIVSCCDAEARDSHAYHGRVVEAPLFRRLPSNCVRVFGHFDTPGNGHRETRFLMQFSLRSLRRRLAQLDAASYHVPVAAVRWRPMDQKNFATVATRHEHGDLGACAHRRSVGNHRVRRQGTVRLGGSVCLGVFASLVVVVSPVTPLPNQAWLPQLAHFGVLQSEMFAVWRRYVGGRIKSDYRFNNRLVYNTFPFPELTLLERRRIEEAVEEVIEARAEYPENSLAELYNPLSSPPSLVKAHRQLDRAVDRAFGRRSEPTETERLAILFTRHAELIAEGQL
jgi:hypothetical protein